jgi:hypothetical protein
LPPHRAASTFAAALPPFLSPLLQGSLEKAIKAINHQGMLPLPSSTTAAGEEEDDEMVLEVRRTECLVASSRQEWAAPVLDGVTLETAARGKVARRG